VATNYDQELVNAMMLHVFNHSSKNVGGSSVASPYLLEPKLPLPSRFVLTNTHCVGHCEKCVPNMTSQEFELGCRSLGAEVDKTIHYAPSVKVAKTVLLFRNPFDIIVARMRIKSRQRKLRGLGDRQEQLSPFADASE